MRPRRARWPWLLLILATLAATATYFAKPLQGYAVTGASYGARVACSCRFEGGRSLGDCRKDFEAGMDLITLSEDRATKSVTARFPLLATQTATYREGWGCVLEPWSN
jgi:hypothetical protein